MPIFYRNFRVSYHLLIVLFSLLITTFIFLVSTPHNVKASHLPPYCSGTLTGSCGPTVTCPQSPSHPDQTLECVDAGESGHYCCEQTSVPAPPPSDICTSDVSCVDGNPCTFDFCSSGTCIHPNKLAGETCAYDSSGNPKLCCSTNDYTCSVDCSAPAPEPTSSCSDYTSCYSCIEDLDCGWNGS